MILVGICGPISSGKSTFAELLTAVEPEHAIHLETSTLVVELANTFNNKLRSHIGSLTQGKDLNQVANECIAALVPQLRIMIGGDIPTTKISIDEADTLVHPDWYEKLYVYLAQVRQLPSMADEHITAANKSHYRPLLQWIGGYFLYKLDNQLLWYEELVRRIHQTGPGITLAVLTAPRQPSEAEYVKDAGGKVIKIVRPGLISDTADVTERQVADIVPDATVINNGSLADLKATAAKVHKALLQDTLRDSYSARHLTA